MAALNDLNQARQRHNAAPKLGTEEQLPQQPPVSATPPAPLTPANRENEVVRVYKCCAIMGYTLLAFAVLAIIVMGYRLHQTTLELDRCGSRRGYCVPNNAMEKETSFCEKELEKWQRLFHDARNYTKDVVSRVISDADSYAFTKSELEECKAHYWYTVLALIATWWVIVCIVSV